MDSDLVQKASATLRTCFAWLKTHFIPILFVLIAIIGITYSGFGITFPFPIPLSSHPVVGVGIGVSHLLLAVLYEWTIKVQRRNKRRREQQHALLDQEKQAFETLNTEDN